jgi:hypothetical protein
MSAPAPPAVRPVAYRPSKALLHWRTEGGEAMEHLLAARRAVGGRGLGRRAAAQQIDYAMTVQYAAQFQRFCRELHAECAYAFGAAVRADLNVMFEKALLHGRRLERQNAHPASIGDDFSRFSVRLWDELSAFGPRYAAYRRRLEELNAWRNAIAHQDFGRVGTDPLTAGIRPVSETLRAWRGALDQLASGMDRVMHARLAQVTGKARW